MLRYHQRTLGSETLGAHTSSLGEVDGKIELVAYTACKGLQPTATSLPRDSRLATADSSLNLRLRGNRSKQLRKLPNPPSNQRCFPLILEPSQISEREGRQEIRGAAQWPLGGVLVVEYKT